MQLQDLLSTKGHGGPRRATKNCNCRRATAELQLQHFLSAEGRGGARRIATARPFVHEGPRRATKNCNCRRATAELQLQHFLSAEGRGGARRIATARPFVHEGPRRKLFIVHSGPGRTLAVVAADERIGTGESGGNGPLLTTVRPVLLNWFVQMSTAPGYPVRTWQVSYSGNLRYWGSFADY